MQEPVAQKSGMTPGWKAAWGAFAAVSAALVGLSLAKMVALGMAEVLGFVTGAACVMLVVRENIWNYPIGIANNLAFIVLFWQARLYGDMSLQAVYILLAVHGWYLWLHGGRGRGRLGIVRTGGREWAVLGAAGVALTAAGTVYFRSIGDSAPFLDALTTVFSLVAQWLLNRKRLENWLVWMSVDVAYVYLYAVRDLYLTAVLYAMFFGLCVAGYRAWRHSLAGAGPAAILAPEGPA